MFSNLSRGAPTGEANGRPWNERPTDVKKCPWGSEVPPILAQVLAALLVPRATTATPLATDGTLWARSSRIRRINSLQTAAWRRPIRILPCWEAVLHISPKPEERRERLLGYTECVVCHTQHNEVLPHPDRPTLMALPGVEQGAEGACAADRSSNCPQSQLCQTQPPSFPHNWTELGSHDLGSSGAVGLLLQAFS